MRYFIRVSATLFFLSAFLVGAWICYNLRDRHPGYSVNLKLHSSPVPQPIRAGFSAVPITPTLIDTWIDADSNGIFNPQIDSYVDRNNNKRFDAFWIAGFGKARAAQSVHDDLWARAIIIEVDTVKVAFVALDLIGFFHDDVVDIRNNIPEHLGIDYCVVASTHNHEAPDVLGIWGPSDYTSGVSPAYRKFIKKRAVAAIELASKLLRPAKLKFAQDLASADFMVDDTRKPIVKDAGLRIMQAIDSEADTTLGVLLNWGNHPETLWGRNTHVSSDFPHYWRQYMEKGVFDYNTMVDSGLGGTAIYFSGAIGGLMTTHKKTAIPSLTRDTSFVAPSFDKIRAQGRHLSRISMRALKSHDTITIRKAQLRVRAKTLDVPLANPLFRLGAALGVIDRGLTKWFSTRTEAAAISVRRTANPVLCRRKFSAGQSFSQSVQRLCAPKVQSIA